MTDLKQQKCVPCEGNVPAATDSEIQEYKSQLSDWNLIDIEGEKRLEKVYKFPDFKSAVTFTNAVGDEAEKQGHHPALLTEWGKVTVTWWTHAIRGLHKNDFIMAAKTDEIKQSL
ncbi:4a-hydroxytetrahydrobiopterin dehydratase [Gloeothece verrucosa]|uniref:Putative pterin-4-alpha-carbinolamine dehydratase n=1 Tax=Gloeothece verrucosa (strain PCC 7822) TaxID=497965 RepID=E0U6V0_GLOV7|nr:4a-hydroxytetrahydrobiopterin dehydratase [Gloeothece verrucosa]ADN15987.1 transcriptional coactivator/pterin dehydratase [Gloeothece verrucosa PCC 7822]